jgi:hypothetical protein
MKPQKMSRQQRVNPFELPNDDDYDWDDDEESRQPTIPSDPVRRPDPFEPIIDPHILDDDLHDKWDWSSQPLYY